MKVGELAKRTGRTVRALHHYDRIGLVSPSARTPAGHRLYGPAEVRRLQRVLSLRSIGLSLEEVGACLDRPEGSLSRSIETQIEHLQSRIRETNSLLGKLEAIWDRIASDGDVDEHDLLETMERMTMFEKYYSDDQLEQLKRRGEEVGQERIEAVQREWRELFAAFEKKRAQGADPASPEVRALAEKAEALIAEFTGGDAGIRASLGNAYRAEGAKMHRMWGVDEETAAYYGQAMRARADPDSDPA